MVTTVTFQVIRDHQLVYEDVPIEHDYKIIPPCKWAGVDLPSTPIETQLILHLDDIDKRDMMAEHGWDLILNYWVKKDEIQEFKDYCRLYLQQFPSLERPFSAIISEFKDSLFNQGKSNEEKLKEVIDILGIVNKTIGGTVNVLLNKLDLKGLECKQSQLSSQ